jgi:hypothetical protein
VVALVALTVGGAVQAADVEAGAKDPSRMVVQLSDLAAGFETATRRARPNATVAKETGVPLTTLIGWGRIDGFQAEYDRSVDPASPPHGAATVSAAASTYRTAKGLARAYRASVERIARTRSPRYVSRALPARLGDAAQLWETRFVQDGITVVLFTVVWRTAGTLSNVAVAGVAGRLSAADALVIARKQDARVRAATRSPGPGLIA